MSGTAKGLLLLAAACAPVALADGIYEPPLPGLSVSLIDGRTAGIEAYFVPPALRRDSVAGYDAIMADPAGKIAQIARLTLRDLPNADGSMRVQEDDEDVLGDIEELLEE